MEKLDREILEWIAINSADAALANQIRSAIVLKRDYMRTGFFVYLSADSDLPEVGKNIRPDAPDILSPELMDGAGSTLFLRDGRLHYLEIYARGGFFPEQLGKYELAAAS
jgi:hypothetical protein